MSEGARHSHSPDVPDPEDVLDRCRAEGLRITRVLRAVVALLVDRESPVRIQECAEADPFLAECDTATLYRMFARLEERGIVRQIGMHGRSAWFGLADSFRHRHYLCCRSCGKVIPLSHECSVASLEDRIARESGFADLGHELTFYGLCPECARCA
ncbi:MAG: Fur family transcriptional regulator [Puniceicoccaceae bacterium]